MPFSSFFTFENSSNSGLDHPYQIEFYDSSNNGIYVSAENTYSVLAYGQNGVPVNVTNAKYPGINNIPYHNISSFMMTIFFCFFLI